MLMSTKKFVRKLQKVSTDSYTLNIPKEVVEKFGWQEKQKLEISLRSYNKHISIRDSK